MVLKGSPEPEPWVRGMMRSQPMHHIFGYGPHLGVPNDLDEARDFMSSFADHMIGISNLPFKGVGQLTRNQSGKVEVGPMAQQATSPTPWRLGPCGSLQEALFGDLGRAVCSFEQDRTSALALLSFASRQEASHPVFWATCKRP
jgi:hypothetical protein